MSLERLSAGARPPVSLAARKHFLKGRKHPRPSVEAPAPAAAWQLRLVTRRRSLAPLPTRARYPAGQDLPEGPP